MRLKHRLWRKIVPAAVVGGVCFQFVGCEPLAAVGEAIFNFNPCLTVLNCDPRVFEFARSGIDGPGVTEADPFCTFPPFCTAQVDPIFGGIGP